MSAMDGGAMELWGKYREVAKRLFAKAAVWRLPRRVVLWGGPAVLAGALFTCGSIAAWIATQEWRADYRGRLLADLQTRVPWIDEVAWYDDGSWVPYPWQPHLPESDENLLSILQNSLRSHQEALTVPKKSGPSSDGQFLSYLEAWGAEARLCARLAQDFPHLAPTICASHTTHIAETWREYFDMNVAATRYVHFVAGQPVISDRQLRTGRLCNLTPFHVRVSRVMRLASEDLADLYRTAFQTSMADPRQVGWKTVQTGTCVDLVMHGFDIVPQMIVSATPANSEFESWFTQTWISYYAPQLGTPEAREALAMNLDAFVQGRFCTPSGDDFDRSVNKVPEACGGSEELLPYVAGISSLGQQLFFGVTYPTLSNYESVLNADGTAIDESQLSARLSSMRELNVIAERYRRVELAWNHRTPRFGLGATLDDSNGPFIQGINATGIPQETVLSELVDIPRVGTILQIDEHEIYGLADVYEALEIHGGSRTDGIESFLRVQMPADDDNIYQYRTRYRFNESSWQEFDKNVGIGTGFKYGLSFGSERVSCAAGMLLGFFEELSNDECTWLEKQRNAYARQIDPLGFQVGEFASFALPIGSAAVKIIGAGRRMKAGTALMLAGAVEAAAAATYEINSAAPAKPDELRLQDASTAAAWGFVFGAMFYR